MEYRETKIGCRNSELDPIYLLSLASRGREGGLDLLAMAAIFPSVISSFFTQNKGGAGPPGPSPRSATAEEELGDYLGDFTNELDERRRHQSVRIDWPKTLWVRNKER